MKRDLWQSVVQAIETAIPEYDSVNEKISFGRAQWARRHAVELLEVEHESLILDLGIGPGSMSELLLHEAPTSNLIGLDASATLLTAARERLKASSLRTEFVRGIFESLPFRDKCFDRAISAYAFRDAIDRETTIREIARVTSENGAFGIVDFGKPDNTIKRFLVTIYVKYFLVLISRISKSKKIRGNPWAMIYPTYQTLGKNKEVVGALRERFAQVRLHEFNLGGLVVILSKQPAQTS